MLSIILASLAVTSAASGGVAELLSKNGSPSADRAMNSALVAESTGQTSLQFTAAEAVKHLDRNSQRIFSHENPLVSTMLLTGNIFIGRYSDNKCTSVAYMQVYPLNVCIKVDSTTYEKYTATESTYDVLTYSDAACTAVISSSLMQSYSTICKASLMTYVSTSSVVSSITPMASLSVYGDNSCSTTVGKVSYTSLDTCIPELGLVVSISGSTMTFNVYSNSLCSGTPTPVSLSVGVCSVGEKLQYITTTPTYLTGYLVEARYSDTSCKSVAFATAYPLAACIRNGIEGKDFVRYTVTASTVLFTLYSDATCTTTTGSGTYGYYGPCSDSLMTYVSTSNVVPSSTPMASLSIYGDYSCSGNTQTIVYGALNTCLPELNLIVSISGSIITAKVYGNSLCSGTATTSSGTLGICRTSEGTKWQSTLTSDSNSGTSKACFAGSETVRLDSGEDRQISLIRAGDRVQAADAAGRISFSEVVFVPHEANRITALFVHITTASGRDIKMTSSHVLPAGTCGSSSPLPLKYASLVKVHDCVMTVEGEERVSTVSTILSEGLHTVVTKEEFIVVNGVIASPFAYNHIAANMYYHLHRFLYDTAPQLLLSPIVRSLNEVLGAVPLLVGHSSA